MLLQRIGKGRRSERMCEVEEQREKETT